MPFVAAVAGILVGIASVVFTFMHMPVWGMIAGSVAFPMGLLAMSFTGERKSTIGKLAGGAMLVGVVGLGLGALAAYGVLFPEVPGGIRE
jgi:hypothetical protein